ncbi:MAG TPA: hypothetical protein PKD72_09860, partial [Gemmatales bacterium]|nr:hypothetical protein [Gemmatales bacterium]
QMVSTLEHLSPEQLVEVKKELKRLHALSLELELVERKEGIPDPFGADATGLVLPDEPVPASEPGMSYTSEVVRPDELDPPSQPRSALSLLKDPDTSVFRLPRKKGELFETVNIVKSEASSSSGSWADRQTEMLNDSLVQEAQQLQQQYGAEHPATEGYGYESEANGLEPVSEAEYAQAAAALQQSAAVQQSDREEQRAALQHEQSSIWRKLSGVFFGKGK